jgi:sterol desaturase/sphingolipid hydroxylase (fatty acid hydroxylase superfamily)
VIHWFLDELGWAPASALLLVENLLVFALALAGGALLERRFRTQRVADPPDPLERTEIVLAAVTVLLNTAVTIAGLWLYRRGLVRFRDDWGLRALADAAVLLLAMDAAMYLLHRLVHLEPFYGWFHALHHRYERPRPLTLFVLSPQEVLAFGGLWLAVIWIYPPSWLGMSIYLALNVAFGTIGHLGVELVRGQGLLAGSRFHADHHRDRTRNFGFYTTIWDRLFSTLRPL